MSNEVLGSMESYFLLGVRASGRVTFSALRLLTISLSNHDNYF